jgi:hypothetical protein
MKKNTPTKEQLLYAMRAIDRILTENKNNPFPGITLGRIDYWVDRVMRPEATPPHLRGPIIQAHADTNGLSPISPQDPDDARRKIIKVR